MLRQLEMDKDRLDTLNDHPASLIPKEPES